MFAHIHEHARGDGLGAGSRPFSATAERGHRLRVESERPIHGGEVKSASGSTGTDSTYCEA